MAPPRFAPSLNSTWNSGTVVHEGQDSFGTEPVSTATQGNWDQGAEAPGWPTQSASTATQGDKEQDGKAPDFGFTDKTVKNRAQITEAGGPSQRKETNRKDNQQSVAPGVKTAKICGNCGEIGHVARGCSNDPYCKNCGGDHKAAECELFQACNLCQQLGHDNRDCYNQIPCTLCNSGGHPAKTCFKVAQKLSVAEKFGIKPETTCESLLGEMGECEDEMEMYLLAHRYLYLQPEHSVVLLHAELKKVNCQYTIIAKKPEVEPCDLLWDHYNGKEVPYEFSVSELETSQRIIDDGVWPETEEENLGRLREGVGQLCGRGLVKCRTCGVYGCDGAHKAGLELKCAYCGSDSHCSSDCARHPKRTHGCPFCHELGHAHGDCDSKPEDWDLFRCHHCKTNEHKFYDCPNKEEAFKEAYAVRKCFNCNQEGHTKSKCPNPKDTSTVECKICHGTGHYASNCEQTKCYNCNQMGHKSNVCVNPKAGRDINDIECKRCHTEGHVIRDCPQQPDVIDVTCRHCQQSGDHYSKDCPTRICGGCGEPGHVTANCPQIQCKHCGVNGHIAQFCKGNCKSCGQAHREHPCTVIYQGICKDCDKTGHDSAKDRRCLLYGS